MSKSLVHRFCLLEDIFCIRKANCGISRKIHDSPKLSDYPKWSDYIRILKSLPNFATLDRIFPQKLNPGIASQLGVFTPP